ncbi:TonB C-terminal domain-containing protein [Marinomonas sp. PE14-40]|uniref:TonB C-terminal domain-containing protein n=1 Tax=Marinomonas sp. PE14-40 TaxID=3060621 RepID=UPI003F67935A
MKLMFIILSAVLIYGCSSSNVKSVYTPKRTFVECTSIEQCALTIHNAVSDNWVRPWNAKNNMRVEIEVTVNDSFEIKDINITKSSGLKSYDKSAIDALNSATPLVELAGLASEEFQKDFTTLNLIFNARDLRR